MKTLESIQKTCKVFEILAKIGMILSFIWAGTMLIGVVGGILWQCDVNIVGLPVESALEMTQTGAVLQMIGVLLSDFVLALTDALLLLFTYRYLKQELADGTPFTVSGAEKIKNLGIMTIVIPLVAICISAVIYECFGVNGLENLDNGAEVALGIALILFSMILRHGAELREASETAQV